jgi:hypothetical protein
MQINVELQQARMRLASVKARLDQLMPYERWCAALNPTEAGKELYRFVQDALQDELKDVQACVSCLTARQRQDPCSAASDCPLNRFACRYRCARVLDGSY